MPKRGYLGEMELMVLLAVVRRGDDAYGVPISQELNLAGAESCARQHLRGAGQARTERFRDFVDWRPNARARRPGETLFSRHAGGSSHINDDPHGTHESVERHTARGRKAFMSRLESNPPRSAIWLLRHACPGSDNQALTGDLIEKFREGRSHGWFWKQVLIAIAVGILGEVQQH
jgi:hypothetical protein